MSKKKPKLTDFDMGLDDFLEPEAKEPVQADPEAPEGFELTDDDLPTRTVGIYIKVEEWKRQEMREWCIRHRTNMTEMLLAGYEEQRLKKGP